GREKLTLMLQLGHVLSSRRTEGPYLDPPECDEIAFAGISCKRILTRNWLRLMTRRNACVIKTGE
ncbi:hypothetical protein BaRGS_00017050, partial [Batillaria attramentaria]